MVRDENGIPEVICDTLNVLGATYANCDGRYKVTTDVVEWAPERPVYRHVKKNRYIFWNAHGLGWSIGKAEYLTSGSHWHRSKSDDDAENIRHFFIDEVYISVNSRLLLAS